MDVWLLLGQSNMAGRGGVTARTWDGVVPAACAPPPGTAVWCLHPDGRAWEAAREPLHAGVDAPGKPCGVGPGLAFAAALLRQPGRPPPCGRVATLSAVGLVPCAVGGSALCEWELPDGPLGARAVARALAALAAPCAPGPARLAGALFYQGETDAGSEQDAASWGERFVRLAGALRAALHAPELPFAVVAITTARSLPTCAHVEQVRAAQLALPGVLPCCCVVDADGLALQPDGLHLTAAAAVELGQRLAAAWQTHEHGWGA
jgi:hypothetical protein